MPKTVCINLYEFFLRCFLHLCALFCNPGYIPKSEEEIDNSIGKIPWRRKWQPTPLFLLGKSHGQGSTMYSVLCIVHRVAESDMNEHTHTNKLINFIIRVLIPNSCQEQKSLTFCLTFKLTSYPETVFWIL